MARQGADVADLDRVIHHREPREAVRSAQMAFAFTASKMSSGSGPNSHEDCECRLHEKCSVVLANGAG
jgi:hypothetical protein